MRVGFASILVWIALATAQAEPIHTTTLSATPPSNDSFTNAQLETGYNWYAYGNTVHATHQRGEVGKALWYSWTAPASGPAVIYNWNQERPFGDFYVFTGANTASLKLVKPLKRNRLAFLFNAVMGTTYHISADRAPNPSQSGNPVNFTLQLLLTTVALTQPTNGAVYKSTDTVPLSMVTTEIPSMIASVKYRGIGPSDTEVDFAPYAGARTNPPPGQWSVYAELTRTDGYVLDTAPSGIIVRPYNDDFADRKVLVGTNITFCESLDQSTIEPGEPGANSNQFSGDIWYSWTAPANGYVLIPRVYSSQFEGINVFTGNSLSTLSGPITRTDNAGNDKPFPVSAGETLQIAVFDMGCLTLDYYGIPANDNFDSAIELSGTNTTIIGNNLAATTEPGEPISAGAGGHTVWYTWTAPTNGTLILNQTSGPVIFTDQYNNIVATLYTGDSLTNLTAISTNTFGPGYVVPPPGPVHFPVWGGINYHLAIDTSSTNFGLSTFAIDLSFVPAQPNDGFVDRAVLTGSDVNFSYNPIGASSEPEEPAYQPHSLWWTWTAPYSGTALISGIMYSPAQGFAYTGDSLTNLTLVGQNNPYFLWSAHAGTTYQIAISSDWTSQIVGLHLHYYTNGTPIEP